VRKIICDGPKCDKEAVFTTTYIEDNFDRLAKNLKESVEDEFYCEFVEEGHEVCSSECGEAVWTEALLRLQGAIKKTTTKKRR